MSDINMSCLAGRLTSDATLAYTSNGTAYSKFSIAVNKSIKKENNWVDKANFFNCILWGKRAESLSGYLKKGKQVTIAGELEQNRYEQNGQKRSSIQIVVNNINLSLTMGNTTDFQDDIPFG